MYFDKLFTFCTALATGAGLTTQLGSDYADLHPGYHLGSLIGAAPTRAFGVGEALEIVVSITTQWTSGSDPNVWWDLLTDDTAALASPVVLSTSGLYKKATLAPGFQFTMSVPTKPGVAWQRYFGIQWTAAAAITAGAWSAGLVVTPQANPS